MASSPRRRWLLPAAVYALILVLSSVPGEALDESPAWIAVAGHAGGYALLAGAIHRAWTGPAAGLLAVVLAVALGVVNEVQQGFVPGRSPDVADVGVDGLGALAGVLIAGALRSRRRAPAGAIRHGGRTGMHPQVVSPRPRRGARPPGRGSAARR